MQIIWFTYLIINFFEFSNCQVIFRSFRVLQLSECFSSSTVGCILLYFIGRLYFFNYQIVDTILNVDNIKCFRLKKISHFYNFWKVRVIQLSRNYSFTTAEFIYFAFVYLILVLVLVSGYDVHHLLGVVYHINHMISANFDIDEGLSFDGSN